MGDRLAELEMKLAALKFIVVVFMLAIAGLGIAIYVKVIDDPPAPDEIRLTRGDSTQEARLTPDGLELTRGAERAVLQMDQLRLVSGKSTARLQPNVLALDTPTGAVVLDAGSTSTNVRARPQSVLSPFWLSLSHADHQASMSVLDRPTMALEAPGYQTFVQTELGLSVHVPPPPPAPAQPVVP